MYKPKRFSRTKAPEDTWEGGVEKVVSHELGHAMNTSQSPIPNYDDTLMFFLDPLDDEERIGIRMSEPPRIRTLYPNEVQVRNLESFEQLKPKEGSK